MVVMIAQLCECTKTTKLFTSSVNLVLCDLSLNKIMVQKSLRWLAIGKIVFIWKCMILMVCNRKQEIYLKKLE